MSVPVLLLSLSLLFGAAGCASSSQEPRPEDPPRTSDPETAPRPMAAEARSDNAGGEPTKRPAAPAGEEPEPAPEPTSPAFGVSMRRGALVLHAPGGQTSTVHLRLSARINGRDWSATPEGWRAGSSGFVAALDGPSSQYRVYLETDPRRPRLGLAVEASYPGPVEVDHEELTLTFDGSTDHWVLGRDLVRREVGDDRHVTDHWTPLEVSARVPAGRVTVVRRAGLPSAVTEATADGLVVHLELDDRGNHPYEPYTECHESYASKLPRLDLGSTSRWRGERVVHQAELWLGEAVPLRVERLPEGRRAAVVFTSHADQSKVKTTRALLWGHSDPDHPTFGRRGLLAHGLALTLTAWAEKGWHADMTDPRFLEILTKAHQAGVEVSPHSTTPEPEDVATLKRLLPRYKQFVSATWIDHQPETNCEALNNGAGVADGDPRYAVIETLRGAGIRYFWAIYDVNPPGGINLLGAGRPSYRPIVLYRNPRLRVGEERPWMFKTTWRFLKSRIFLNWYNADKMRRLIRERGIHVAHVYMDIYTPSGRLADRPLVEPDGLEFRIKDEADQTFARLGKLQRSKTLWVTSFRALGDHMTGVSELSIDYQADGSARLTAGSHDLTDVSVTVPITKTAISVDGSPPDGVRWGQDETTFWFDVTAGGSRTISLGSEDGGRRLMPLGSTVPRSQ